MTEAFEYNALKAYFTDDAVKRATDTLVGKLAGDKLPEMTWDEARNYNRALLMACQIRTEFVDLHFRIFEETFGMPNSLPGSQYFYDYCNPNYVWIEKYIELVFFVDGPAEDGGKCISYFVSTKKNRICLEIMLWTDENTVVKGKYLPAISGWKTISETEEADAYLQTDKKIDIDDYLKDPKVATETLSAFASEAIDVLKRDWI